MDFIYYWARNSTREISIVSKVAEKKPGTTVLGTVRGSIYILTNRLLREIDETNIEEP